jgi:hypothetical protein
METNMDVESFACEAFTYGNSRKNGNGYGCGFFDFYGQLNGDGSGESHGMNGNGIGRGY